MNPPKKRKAQFYWVQYESPAFHPTFIGCWILLQSLLNNGRCFLNALRLNFIQPEGPRFDGIVDHRQDLV